MNAMPIERQLVLMLIRRKRARWREVQRVQRENTPGVDRGHYSSMWVEANNACEAARRMLYSTEASPPAELPPDVVKHFETLPSGAVEMLDKIAPELMSALYEAIYSKLR